MYADAPRDTANAIGAARNCQTILANSGFHSASRNDAYLGSGAFRLRNNL